MRIFGRMMVTGVAAVVAGLPGMVALAERPVAADTDKTGTQCECGGRRWSRRAWWRRRCP